MLIFGTTCLTMQLLYRYRSWCWLC